MTYAMPVINFKWNVDAELNHGLQGPRRPAWRTRTAVLILSLSSLVFIATAIALLSKRADVRVVADLQRLQRNDDLGVPNSPHMNEAMNDRFLIPVVAYLLIAAIYIGLAISAYRRAARARSLVWGIGSLITLASVWWGLARTWQPTHVTDEPYDTVMSYIDGAMPAWLVVIESWPLFVLIGGFIPVGLLLNAGYRSERGVRKGGSG